MGRIDAEDLEALGLADEIELFERQLQPRSFGYFDVGIEHPSP